MEIDARAEKLTVGAFCFGMATEHRKIVLSGSTAEFWKLEGVPDRLLFFPIALLLFLQNIQKEKSVRAKGPNSLFLTKRMRG